MIDDDQYIEEESKEHEKTLLEDNPYVEEE